MEGADEGGQTPKKTSSSYSPVFFSHVVQHIPEYSRCHVSNLRNLQVFDVERFSDKTAFLKSGHLTPEFPFDMSPFRGKVSRHSKPPEISNGMHHSRD